MSAIDYMEWVITLSNRLDSAQREYSDALGDRQRNWRDDPAGRRARGQRMGTAHRRLAHAMTDLILAVQDEEAPAVVREHFATNGPTYYEAARCASIMRMKV